MGEGDRHGDMVANVEFILAQPRRFNELRAFWDDARVTESRPTHGMGLRFSDRVVVHGHGAAGIEGDRDLSEPSDGPVQAA